MAHIPKQLRILLTLTVIGGGIIFLNIGTINKFFTSKNNTGVQVTTEENPSFGTTEIINTSTTTDEQKLYKQKIITPVIAFGENTHGQLGTNITTNDSLNSQYSKIYMKNSVVDVAAGDNYSLALVEDGTVWAWGNNASGQLGNRSISSYEIKPAMVIGLPKIKKVFSSNDFSLALAEDGTVWAWGDNFSGQLGDGTHQNNPTPKIVKGLSKIKDLAPGYRFALALSEDGTVWAWGASCNKTGNPEFQKFMEQLSAGMTFTQGYFSPGSSNTTDNSQNRWEECLGEQYININSTVPIKVDLPKNIKEISAGYGHMLALTTEGTVWAWGCNKYDQVGIGIEGNTEKNSKPTLLSLSNITEISAGFRHSFALDKNGVLWAWGHNLSSELGIENKQNVVSPIKADPKFQNIKHIYAGKDFSFAKLSDGSVMVWGWNNFHNEPTGSNAAYVDVNPVVISKLAGVTKIVSGQSHILAL